MLLFLLSQVVGKSLQIEPELLSIRLAHASNFLNNRIGLHG